MARENEALVAPILERPFLFVSVLFALACVFTRVTTQRTSQLARTSSSNVKTVPLVPYWTPWLAHTIAFASQFTDYLRAVNAKFGDVFALKIAGNTFDVVTSPSLMKDLLNNPKHPIDMDSLTWHLLKHFFGDVHGAWKKIGSNFESAELLWGGAHKALTQMMREPFLGNATTLLLRSVEGKTENLVGGNANSADQERWERVARTKIVSGQDSGDFVAEVDLHVLLRDWVGYIASPLVMGQRFMDNNPAALEDLWLFDSKVNTFMLGLPHRLIPGMAPAVAARERLLTAIEEWHNAMFAITDGRDPGTKYEDMSDVPHFLWDRVRALRKLTAGVDIDPDRATSSANLAIYWAMNVNANQVIFWMIFYIFSDAQLAAQLRLELQPFVQLKRSTSTPSAVETPKLTIDWQGLQNKCPLLRGTFLETMRLESQPTSFKSVKKDFSVTAPVHNANAKEELVTETYSIKKDDMICMPMGVHQIDPAYWPEPETFNPRRFWVESVDEHGQKAIKVDYKTLQVWGGGRTMCKGRSFAEREVLIFTAALLMSWDFEIADPKNVDPRTGGWIHPGRITTAGTYAPKKDIRVRVSRRRQFGA